MNLSRIVNLFFAPLAFILIFFFADLAPGSPEVTRMAAVTAWMCIWWMTEAVPLVVTSLLPLVLLPVLGVMDSKTVSAQYIDNIIFLFIGGFILAFAIEKWGLHKRIALGILSKIGTKAEGILGGVMLCSYFLSMWLSNTATVLMLLAAVTAIIYQVDPSIKDEKDKLRFSASLLLGLAFSATIGGMATLVGTPTNMIFIKIYKDMFPASPQLSFVHWFKFGFPISLVTFILCFFLIRFIILGSNIKLNFDTSFFTSASKQIGPKTYEEKVVIAIFLLTVFLWFFRIDLDLGFFTIPGWSEKLSFKEYIHDSTIAIFSALLLFLIPTKNKRDTLINWADASKLPLEIILLFGSGFALAKGFEVSGLSGWLANQLLFLKGQSLWLIILFVCITVTIISEFASNVASIQLVLPVLISLQQALDVNPLYLMIPATLAASLGFMLPIATAPNTIVFATKKIKVQQMLLTGFFLDIIGILIITVGAMSLFSLLLT